MAQIEGRDHCCTAPGKVPLIDASKVTHEGLGTGVIVASAKRQVTKVPGAILSLAKHL